MKYILLGLVMTTTFALFAQNPNYGASHSCHVEIFSVPDLCDQRRGVVIIFEKKSGVYEGVGTAFLLNNAKNDSRPYLMTTAHNVDTNKNGVISSAELSRLDSLRFVFNYQHATFSSSTLPEPGSDEYLTGAQVVASRSDLLTNQVDWILLELNERIPGFYNAYFCGFDVSDEKPDKVRVVHHPQGDVKKYAYSSDKVKKDGHWKWTLNEWHAGTMEHGSSGAPWFNPDLQVIGIQSSIDGTSQNCDEKRDAYAFRLYKAWDESADSNNSANENQLKHWLGDGDITELVGWDPCVESHFFEFANDLHTSANVDPTISVPGSRSYDGVYTASNLIQTGNQTSIVDQTKVEFYASKIVLQPGFSTGTGSIFVAAPEPCLGGCGNGKRLTNDSQETTHSDKDKNLVMDIEVYPNPTTGILHVVVNEREEVRSMEIEVRDVYGKLAFAKTSKENNTAIDLSSSAKGIYLVTIRMGEELFVKRLIHQ